jgi:hypothetical protein
MSASWHRPVRFCQLGEGLLALALLVPSAAGQEKDKEKLKADKTVETWKVELDEDKNDDKPIDVKQGEVIQISVQSETKGDVDLIVLDANKKRVAADVTYGPNCFVKFTAAKTEQYTVQVKNWGPGASKSVVELKRVAEVAVAADAGNKTWRDQLTVNDPLDKVRQGCRAKTYSYKMKAGVTYTIRMHNDNTPGFDPFLRLENAQGVQLAQDDDSDGFPNAKIVFACQQDETYRIIATSFSQNVGAYVLSVQPSRGEDPLRKDLPKRE